VTADENPSGTRTVEPPEDDDLAQHEDTETTDGFAPVEESETAEQDAAAEDDDVAASFGPRGSFDTADGTGPTAESETADDLETHEDYAAGDYERTEDVEAPADSGHTSEPAPLGYAAPAPVTTTYASSTAAADPATAWEQEQEQELSARLREIQLGFVDDPRRAALNAQELLVEVLQSLTEDCVRERDGLRGSVAETAPDTERMRLVVQRARTLIDAVSGADRPDGAPAGL
jgi:hypothetical protein